MKNGKIMLKDIAKKADCSVQAASAILNPNGRSTACFSEELATKVRSTAKSLGYCISAKRTNRQKLLLLFDKFEPYNSELARTVAQMSTPWDYECLPHFLDCLNNNDKKCDGIVDFISDNRVKGVVAFNYCEQKLKEMLDELRIPILYLNPARTLKNNCFYHNDHEGVGKAMQLAAASGVKNVAYVGERINAKPPHQSIPIRSKAVQVFAEEFGLQFLVTDSHKYPLQQLQELLKS